MTKARAWRRRRRGSSGGWTGSGGSTATCSRGSIESGLLPLFLAAHRRALRARSRGRLGGARRSAAGGGRRCWSAPPGWSGATPPRILLALNARGPIFSGAEGDATEAQLELFDTLDQARRDEVLRMWRAHPAYRASVARVSTRAGQAA